MSSYIDKDKLTQILEERCDNIYSEDMLYENWFIRTQIIDEMPTEDVTPIIYGKWVKSDIPDSALSKCSICGFDCGAYTFRYCPMCGAKNERVEEKLK